MSRLTLLQKNGITNMVCKNEDCHTPETYCPCTITDQCDCPTLKEVIEKLTHYEDLEEQGRLIEQKHGKWIPFELDTRGHIEIIHYECSSCHEISDDATMYCPNCGAKMDEVK